MLIVSKVGFVWMVPVKTDVRMTQIAALVEIKFAWWNRGDVWLWGFVPQPWSAPGAKSALMHNALTVVPMCLIARALKSALRMCVPSLRSAVEM